MQMTNRSDSLLVATAALFGAAGVAAAAAASHATGDPRLGIASNFLMLHAAAILGAVGAARTLGLTRLATGAVWGLAAGTLLFSGDLMVRVFFGSSPLPLLAPIGGSLLIGSWALLGVAAVRAALGRT